METSEKEFSDLVIPLEEIKSSTENFDESRRIGSGGFGKVYRGEISHSKGRTAVAIKRLDVRFGQGNKEFWKEIMTLSCYKHENLISLEGFCNEGHESILVYELASRGSLDRYLSSPKLTWIQRLKISIDAARGLRYLHDPMGTQQRVIHRDIKSANILLFEKWNAKIADLGLSRFGPANQPNTAVYSNAKGTYGYIDPLYAELEKLTKESDVYSFGVVLFEVLCGRLCFEKVNGQPNMFILVPSWKQSYEQNKLDDIIFEDMKQQMDSTSLEKFSEIAYQCLQESREQRPTMENVLKNLEIAIEYQDIHEKVKLPKDYKEMLSTAKDSPKYTSDSQLKKDFLTGLLLNDDKMRFSMNMKGENCEMISIEECLISTASEPQHLMSSSELGSIFPVGCYEPLKRKFKVHVRTQYLSPGITYTVNLVFKNKMPNKPYLGLKCKLEGKKSYSFLSDKREDGWLMAELYHLTSDEKIVNLEIELNTKQCQTLQIDGIEFKPLEKVENEVLTDVVDTVQPISDTEAYWEKKLPNDYEEIIKWSKYRVRSRTKKELYHNLCNGFLVNDNEQWFSLAKNGKKCIMIPAREALEEDKWDWKPALGTRRFAEVADSILPKFDILCKFRSKMLSPQTTYATYLVYKLEEGCCVDPFPVQVKDKSSTRAGPCYIYLRTPQTPIIRWNQNVMKVDKKIDNPTNRPKIKGLPRNRTDGWMEVQVSELRTRDMIKMITTHLKFSSKDIKLDGITVLGVEYKPV